jgi:hypothetical protein
MNVSVVDNFHLLFIKSTVLIGVPTDFLKLGELELPLRSSHLGIYIALINSLVCSVLQLDRKMASFAKDQSIW